jgi:NAD(P)-dependent dehydrogenase (short-subunit alcohol dehydrogenase family)
MDGRDRIVVITGGNAGIGLETAVALTQQGSRVVFTARDPARGAAALEEVRRRTGRDTVEVMALDLASFASIRAFAAELGRRYDHLDVLVSNAGGMLRKRSETVEGFETTFGVNHLGHFLLTELLRDQLVASAPARIVVVASEAHRMALRGLPFSDLQAERRYVGAFAYNRSKLANVLHARELARRLAGTGVTANALHPGYVDSHFGRDGDVGFERVQALGARLFAISPEEGAKTSVHLAMAPEVEGVTGGYFARSAPKRPSRHGRDDGMAARLWAVSEQLVAAAG